MPGIGDAMVCLSSCFRGAYKSVGFGEGGQTNSQLSGACARKADRPAGSAYFPCDQE